MHKFEGRRIKVPGRIRERCHPSHRFFTLCHVAASRLFHKAFLLPFRMIGIRKGFWYPVLKHGATQETVRKDGVNVFFLSTDFFLYFLYTKGRTVLFL